jgi:hypothetical protein
MRWTSSGAETASVATPATIIAPPASLMNDAAMPRLPRIAPPCAR